MEIKLKVVAELTLEKNETNQYPLMKYSSVELIIPDNLDRSKYINAENKYPNYDGISLIRNTLVQGLIGTIHMAHQNKVYDSAAHLREIIKELEDGFVSNIEIIPIENK